VRMCLWILSVRVQMPSKASRVLVHFRCAGGFAEALTSPPTSLVLDEGTPEHVPQSPVLVFVEVAHGPAS